MLAEATALDKAAIEALRRWKNGEADALDDFGYFVGGNGVPTLLAKGPYKRIIAVQNFGRLRPVTLQKEAEDVTAGWQQGVKAAGHCIVSGPATGSVWAITVLPTFADVVVATKTHAFGGLGPGTFGQLANTVNLAKNSMRALAAADLPEFIATGLDGECAHALGLLAAQLDDLGDTAADHAAARELGIAADRLRGSRAALLALMTALRPSIDRASNLGETPAATVLYAALRELTPDADMLEALRNYRSALRFAATLDKTAVTRTADEMAHMNSEGDRRRRKRGRAAAAAGPEDDGSDDDASGSSAPPTGKRRRLGQGNDDDDSDV